MIHGRTLQAKYPYSIMSKISVIAAIARNRAIGYQNRLLYWLPNDLKRFKALTTGHTIIMGRKTFESLPKGALPNRRNVVLSRQEELQIPGAECYTSLEAALASCQPNEQAFIIGGDSVYRQALAYADELCLTHIEDTPEQADAFFPPFTTDEWEVTFQEKHLPDEKHGQAYTFINYKRK